jgi:hypothetical protein
MEGDGGVADGEGGDPEHRVDREICRDERAGHGDDHQQRQNP